MTKFKPSAAQQRFYDWVSNESGNCILNAVAGAGKTTTIMHGIEKMRGTVWFGVYNKKMADEIKEKLAGNRKLAKRAQFKAQEQVTASTFHSLGSSLVRSITYPNRADVDDKKVAKIVDSIILEKEAHAQQERDDLRALAPTIIRLVSMAKNRGFVPASQVRNGLSNWDDVAAWQAMADHFDIGDTLDFDEIDTAIGFARTVLRRSTKDIATIDFDDMVYLPLARKMNLKPWHRFQWVLIDEAQDTNPTRRALAELVLAPGGRLVAVGDPHQAIYGFTGADNDSLEQIRYAFDAIELPLTTTYRCPKNVVAHAQQWVSHIEAHDNNADGEVITQPYMDFVDALPNIDRAAYGETAILCRFNKYLVGLCFKMIRMGLPAKIEGRAIGDGLVKLATRWKSAKTVNGLTTKLEAYQEREIAKATAKGNEAKVDRIVDEVATLMTIIDRVRGNGLDRVTDVVDAIEEIFADDVSGKNLITLCSAHKSKGLEWDTVYLLDREALMPSARAKKDWEVAQENNLIYVAVTRAKQTLVEVTGVVEENDPTKREE
ncbi:DNA helicase [Dinoroseobacter phage vB_DshS-R5C]|uniref:ATP-dependent DNA helicase n=1 Tax=Dinoroseobacter phage vB_DshS-R5C TaxID=1965368 RepID=A0A1V0DYD4_9CAUD|nr:DNA helicase [Dinoroseobacter phage vB_DshS-R5C]ARB06163.1 ATP-dependent DNA helicase [Dinoroseobacter phage vB_DshS-R5C]